MQVAFYISGVVAVLATTLMLTRLNAFHALLYLVVSLLAAAIIFFTLGAPLAAALEVIIYAGAIMVLFVFVVMLLNLGDEAVETEKALLAPSMWTGPGILAAVLAAELIYLIHRGPGANNSPPMIDPRQVAVALYAPYLIGVEVASMLLLAGIVGAYHLGQRNLPAKQNGETADRALRKTAETGARTETVWPVR
jgi:NADH-quinone oxidoreductase subunit J